MCHVVWIGRGQWVICFGIVGYIAPTYARDSFLILNLSIIHLRLHVCKLSRSMNSKQIPLLKPEKKKKSWLILSSTEVFIHLFVQSDCNALFKFSACLWVDFCTPKQVSGHTVYHAPHYFAIYRLVKLLSLASLGN